MRSLISVAMLAGVFGPLAGTAFAADLDEPMPPPPPPYVEPHPVPPAFVPGPVPPVYYRVRPRPIVYPRPYPVDGPPPVVRLYGEPRPYADGYDRPYPREPRPTPDPYGEPGARGYSHEAEVYRHERESYGDPRGLDRRELDRRDPGDQRYGRYLSHEELERRAKREHGYDHDRYADRDRGYDRDERDRFADRAPPRDYDR